MLKLNPRYQRFLEQQGLTAPADFLELPSVIICGHPDRNVARVTLGAGSNALRGFLKREHRIRWKDRLLNALAGFGFTSKSGREASVLGRLQRAGIGCPEVMAVADDGRGRAFLLLRELSDTRELRLFLQDQRNASADHRRHLARRLGEALAEFHNAGFDHPDLYSKHVLVHPSDLKISFLDWQRSRQRHHVAWRRRCRDLAALEATLVEDLATTRERLFCLRAYLRASKAHRGKGRMNLRSVVHTIGRIAGRILGQRRLRELRRVPVPNRAQGLIWQDGEALCLTPEFQADLAGHIPDWLRLASFPSQPGSWEARTWVDLPQSRQALLIRRRESHLLSTLWSLLRRRPPVSPELRQAGHLLRLERYGIRTGRLLAFGQQSLSYGTVVSFLLIEPYPGAVRLGDWLAQHSTELNQRRRLIHEAAGMLRRIHDLHYHLGGQPRFAVVQPHQETTPAVVLATIDGLQSRRRLSPREALKDQAALDAELSISGRGRTGRATTPRATKQGVLQ